MRQLEIFLYNFGFLNFSIFSLKSWICLATSSLVWVCVDRGCSLIHLAIARVVSVLAASYLSSLLSVLYRVQASWADSTVSRLGLAIVSKLYYLTGLILTVS